ncbi:hypothetical protein Tco_0161577 [Tanacetum coccineum]
MAEEVGVETVEEVSIVEGEEEVLVLTSELAVELKVKTYQVKLNEFKNIGEVRSNRARGSIQEDPETLDEAMKSRDVAF